MSQTPQGVLIDLDGTLVDTAADFTAAINALLDAQALPRLTRAEVIAGVGKGSEHLIRHALHSATGQPPAEADVAASLAAYLDIYGGLNGNHAELYAGVREGLSLMRDNSLRLVCVTNKPAGFARPLLARLGIGQFFELVVGGDSLARRKPDPLPMTYAAEWLGHEPSELLAIGDSENDVLAARGAGMPVWLVPYGYNHGRPAASAGADAIVDTLLDAARRLAAGRASS